MRRSHLRLHALSMSIYRVALVLLLGVLMGRCRAVRDVAHVAEVAVVRMRIAPPRWPLRHLLLR